MALTPEAKVKRKVVAHLKEMGVYYFFPVTSGYGASGVPDIICCYQGAFVAFECKAGKNTPTPLQQHQMNLIIEAGGSAYVVNESNIDEVPAYLSEALFVS